MAKDYYNLLGVSKTATQDEIKKAYHKLAHKYHPDKAGGDEQKFKDINEAHQVLKDAEKRKKYDQFGASFEQMGGWESATGGAHWEDIMNAFRQGSGGGGQYQQGPFGGGFTFDLGDIFSEFFGGGDFGGQSSGTRRRSHRGRDVQVAIAIDFNESVFGTERTIELEKFDVCSRCSGNRAEPGTPIVSCTTCGGTGQITQTRSTILGVMRTSGACSVCQGEGKVAKQRCSVCNGDGMQRVKKKLKIKIPAGIQNEEAIRLQNEGEVSGDLSRYGDLYVQIHVKEHYKFARQGDDVYSNEPISFTVAALGGKIFADTVDGKVELKIPTGTPSGKVFKLKRKGVPHLHSYGRGDQYITVKIVVPEQISNSAKKLLRQLQEEGM